MKSLGESLSTFILSVSGWRSVFALESIPANTPIEDSIDSRIPASHAWIMMAAGYSLGEFYKRKYNRPLTLALGKDSRPTGARIEESLLKGLLLHQNIYIAYIGFSAITEIMAFTSESKDIDGFIYVSASHNPIGYNGLKMGMGEGGCLNEARSNQLIEIFWKFVYSVDAPILLEKADTKKEISARIPQILNQKKAKEKALSLYSRMATKIVLGNDPALQDLIINRLTEKSIGILGEMNGSARFSSIDPSFFNSLGLKTEWHNTELGHFFHSIVPEGPGLDLCQKLLLSKHSEDPSFSLGYVPDCDGDRGNLVFYNEKTDTIQTLESQTVFSLVVIAELSFYFFKRSLFNKEEEEKPIAVVVNDATSLRIEEIVSYFGGKVLRAEVGESNLISLSDEKIREGFKVIVIGEGSNGGCIIPPSRVRDPLYTVSSFSKLLSIEEIYDQWFYLLNLDIPKTRTIANMLESLPRYQTTGAFEGESLIKVSTRDQAKLKKRYMSILEKNWKDLKKWIPNLSHWTVVAYEGTKTFEGKAFASIEATGGLKILLKNKENQLLGSLWMRKSKTEPIFRALVDLKDSSLETEKSVLFWHKEILRKADYKI